MQKSQAVIISVVFLAAVLTTMALLVVGISAGLLKAPERSGGVLDASETRELESFSQIELDINAEVTILQSEETKIDIQADSSDLEEIRTRVQDGKLIIDRQVSFMLFDTTPAPELTIYLQDLEAITINGAGKVSSDSLELEELAITINGSGDIALANLSSESVEAVINGSGRIDLSGEAPNQQITINASGDFLGHELAGQDVIVQINGSGSAEVDVETSLRISIVGSGDVRYTGEPSSVDRQVVGSGEIKQIGANSLMLPVE